MTETPRTPTSCPACGNKGDDISPWYWADWARGTLRCHRCDAECDPSASVAEESERNPEATALIETSSGSLFLRFTTTDGEVFYWAEDKAVIHSTGEVIDSYAGSLKAARLVAREWWEAEKAGYPASLGRRERADDLPTSDA